MQRMCQIILKLCGIIQMNRGHDICIGITVNTVAPDERLCQKRQLLLQLAVSFTHIELNGIHISSCFEF